MARIRKFGVPTPALYLIDEMGRKIFMEYLGMHAYTVKEFLYGLNGNFEHPLLSQLVEKIGTYLGLLHSNDQIHGDLTTSNMMIRPKLSVSRELESSERVTIDEIVASGSIGEVYLIDFGLSFVSGKIEDKAVDIYVLKRAFISTHPGSEALFEKILDKYKEKCNKGP
jgi:TP53 regulating kinase and related kinases